MIEHYASKLISEGRIIDVITLDDAKHLITEELSKRKNLKKFCRDHSLCYNNVVAIKNGKGSRYPILIQQLLSIICQVETEEFKVYKINTKTQTL